MPKPLIIATRKSPLALAQTRVVAAALEKNGIKCLIKTFSTTGDEITDKPLADIGGKELFINNLRRALR
ncbi:MAG: hydroxymethylbilane synthase, partial [Betaproteobacteria bacterium]|nr:hydroxymethylbilane synthase [Betaproteobacteria bacterium]